MIPASCIDNFYEDPDSIRDFALSLNYSFPYENENFPGERTDCLSSIDKNFYNFSIRRLLSCFVDIDSSTTWEANTYFQKIHCFNDKKDHLMNKGWIHLDSSAVFAAVVYLNKNTFLDSGTSLFHPKIELVLNDDDIKLRNNLYHNISVDEKSYVKSIQKHNDQFDLTLEFKNRYNRMIAYSAETWHTQSCFWVPEEFRFTQVFFIQSLNNDSKIPSFQLKYS